MFTSQVELRAEGEWSRCKVSDILTPLLWTITKFIFLLFGRGPNRVMETACFDANVQ